MAKGSRRGSPLLKRLLRPIPRGEMVTLYQEDGEAFMGRYGRRLKKL